MVVFEGWEQHQLRELVACVDVVIAPSLAEGFGSVHSEACAMKKTLITTQVAAIPEVVSGKVKFISAASSSAIVQGIMEVRRGDYEEIAEKHFDWDSNITNIEKLYYL
ncbi:MAG: glycosyltransferase [Candidatus Peribacteria bacterium]|nr:glycosyltransferase [Candidatus Peribacteria bacterium]